MSIFEIITSNKEIIQTLSSVATLIIAFYGFSVWKRQLKGSSRYAIAKDIMKNTYRVKNAFSHVRNPFMSASEYPKELQEKMILDKEDNLKASIYAYNKRLEILNSEFNKLEESIIEGAVVLNININKIIIPLRKCRAELVVAIQEHIENTGSRHTQDPKRQKEIMGIMYETGITSKYDILSKYIDNAVEYIIKSVKPYLTNKLLDNIVATMQIKDARNFLIKMPEDNEE